MLIIKNTFVVNQSKFFYNFVIGPGRSQAASALTFKGCFGLNLCWLLRPYYSYRDWIGCFGHTKATGIGLAASAMSDIVVNNASALMLDVGGVLSDLNSAKHDWDTIYKSALTGAYCFLQSFKRTYPGIPVHVISRVNRPADNHWVVRFCEALGAGASVHQVKHRHQKGEVARSLGITICVDDAYECVHSVALACPNWQTGILFGGRPTPQGSRHDAWVLQRTIVCGDWGQVASALGCDVPSQVWRWFGENGPQRQPHNATRLREAWRSSAKLGMW